MSSPLLPQRHIFADMAICITLMAALLWMPATLGALAQGYGLGTRALSHLAFAEVSGFLLGTLFTNAKSPLQLKRWVLIGCAMVFSANLLLMLLAPAVPFIALRPIAGFAAGVGFGYGLRSCSASAKPTRSFGILTALMSLMMIAGFQLISRLISSRDLPDGVPDVDGIRQVVKIVFATYAALGITAAIILLTNRSPVPNTEAPVQPRTRGALQLPVVICLLAIVLSFIGQGAIWAFLQTLGIAHGFPVNAVANAMSAFAVMGIVGSLSAGALPNAVPRHAALGVALLILWLGLYMLYAPASLGWFILGCAIGGFYWNFALSLMLGLLAMFDHTGRGSVLGGTMSSTGSALGPLIAGLLIQGTSYQLVGWTVGALCMAALMCIWYAERRHRSGQPQEAGHSCAQNPV